MGKLMPWTQRVLDLLRSGPQPYEYLIAEAGSLIPPGRAFRETERNRKRNHEKRHSTPPNERKYAKDEEAIIRTGKRIIISNSILTWVREGRLVKFVGQEGQQMIRIPGAADSVIQHGLKCNKCGEEIYSNSKFDWAGCMCDGDDIPSWINGGPINPRVGINGPSTNITRYVLLARLPRYYRSEFTAENTPLKNRPWVIERE